MGGWVVRCEEEEEGRRAEPVTPFIIAREEPMSKGRGGRGGRGGELRRRRRLLLLLLLLLRNTEETGTTTYYYESVRPRRQRDGFFFSSFPATVSFVGSEGDFYRFLFPLPPAVRERVIKGNFFLSLKSQLIE